jgi:hypothetical protein
MRLFYTVDHIWMQTGISHQVTEITVTKKADSNLDTIGICLATPHSNVKKKTKVQKVLLCLDFKSSHTEKVKNLFFSYFKCTIMVD